MYVHKQLNYVFGEKSNQTKKNNLIAVLVDKNVLGWVRGLFLSLLLRFHVIPVIQPWYHIDTDPEKHPHLMNVTTAQQYTHLLKH